MKRNVCGGEGDARADGVDADALAGVHHRELARHGEDGTLCVCAYKRMSRAGRGQQRSGRDATLDAVSIQRENGASARVNSYTTRRGKGRTGKLGRGGAHDGDEARGVDDAPAGVQALRRVRGVVAHREDGVFGAPPDALEVDRHREVPDALFGVQGVVVFGVHDTWDGRCGEYT